MPKKRITKQEYKQYDVEITVLDGSGSHTTPNFPNVTLREIIFTPTTSTTAFKYQLSDSSTTVILDSTKVALAGRRAVTGPEVPLIGQITISLTSVSADEVIKVKMIYY